nr:hypothetical protein [Tanacetum cinerariifolium]
TRTRRLISILKKNWKDVTKEEKNFLWSDIKAHFRLENDDVKKHFYHVEEERNDPDKATELHLILDLRSSNYCLAQAPYDKVEIKPLPAELIDVSNKLAQAASELSQSSNESKSREDPLIMMLGPEHEGRYRGVGCDIRNESQGQQNESFSPRQDHRRLNLSSTKSIVREEQQEEHNESTSTKPVDVSTLVFKIQCIKEENYGCLYVLSFALAGQQLICSTVTIYPILGDEVPTKRLMPQHERAPSSKKGNVNDTPKEPNKKDKASEDTTNKQKLIQRVENEKAANRKRLQDLENDILTKPQSVIDGYNKWMSRADIAEPYSLC